MAWENTSTALDPFPAPNCRAIKLAKPFDTKVDKAMMRIKAGNIDVTAVKASAPTKTPRK
ncbi:hypothetical protein GCM10009084_33210 [Marinomonas primoryensis]